MADPLVHFTRKEEMRRQQCYPSKPKLTRTEPNTSLERR